ncbi:putative proteasome regulatory non-ATPase subunit [Leishmania infantum JPCM5]|uniref:Proteasome_regulatory_non-ATPase_subunit_-_putative n=2 Tax=Leishmania infantum TaxID=5671 RepID=A0A6L0XJN7_LEIIN|nr:putative proteasome regulatory non-ATPase subunit [Leishmania infantum JPCM5]CAC9506640.1 proteasome_regulatory_non-ATPase_subunit_-_putative [Leishmania infantum]CAM69557.1 putative proteasome regulatory non-ATPase subunit [Leishmania infantum JPCM5]SUZ43510.1 proteasome_regulatory_non-ATPase_subunit_-_putative [Leishmania infantum]|eukprot:XP_001466518.1 putative proteasome regulatory non-ATPase subunit [Leishmania infantum JPCM5]
MGSKGEEVAVDVPSKDPQKDATINEKKKKENEHKMSEEDMRIKEEVELLVTRAADSDVDIAKIAVERLVDLLRTSSSGSLAAVPPPLKHVRALYPELEAALKSSQNPSVSRRLHDLLSFISMTLEPNNGGRTLLEHKLKGTKNDLAQWGHEYLRFLAGAIGEEWRERPNSKESTEHLNGFVDQIVSYMLAHQDEATAIDLLMEIDGVTRILPLVEASNYKRIANYIAAISKYLTRPSDSEALRTVYDIYKKMQAYPDAALTALRLNDRDLVAELFSECKSKPERLQMALLCARQKCFLDLDSEEDELLQDANGNMSLSQLYRHTAQEFDSMAPKTLEEVFKMSPDEKSGPKDLQNNLVCAFVSGLANCGYGTDKFLSDTPAFFFDQREDRIISTTAALGLLHLWDHTEGLQQIDKYFYSESTYVKAGACLASGIVMCGVKNPFDPALGLLSEQINTRETEVAIGAILGLGYAYAGTRKEDVKELLIPLLADSEQKLLVQCMAAYALATVFVASADEDISETMMNCLMEVPENKLKEPYVRYLILALGCMFLGRQEAADTLLDATRALPVAIQRYTEIVVRSCAFAATGNVVVIQSLFHVIAENDEAPENDEEKNDDESREGNASEEAAAKPEEEKTAPLNHKAAAVLGIGLVAVGEDLGMEMTKRAIIHSLLADTVSKGKDPMSGRCAVPLVYALLSAGNPNMPVVETLNRLAHDSDLPTATNAITAMGIVAAGSNNARVATKLHSLSSYYQKPIFAGATFAVRLAEGFCAMGKGHLTLSCLQNDSNVVNMTALMGVLSLLHSSLDLSNTLLGECHYMFYAITPSISPRMMMAVNENMEPVDSVLVRVGLPVDTVALPGNPKTITGFQTQKTPVLLSATDKVECADVKYVPVGTVLEGICVVKERPQAE